MTNSNSEGGGQCANEARPRIDIAEALHNAWFETWYQPKIDLKRKCLAGAEAVARINHPQYGILPPGSFSPEVADGCIAELTEHSVLAALFDWSMFEEAGFNLRLAVNVPVSALFASPIVRMVSEYRPKDAHWPGIVLEVAESQFVRDTAALTDVATNLRECGVSLSIDEFGAGCSSLSNLRDFPFCELKIDRAFVRNCAVDGTNAAICRTAIDFAHQAGVAAAAEGVEANMDLQALMVMGCDFGQGAIMAPAMPKSDFLDLLRRRKSRPAAASAGAAGNGAAKERKEPVKPSYLIGRSRVMGRVA